MQQHKKSICKVIREVIAARGSCKYRYAFFKFTSHPAMEWSMICLLLLVTLHVISHRQAITVDFELIGAVLQAVSTKSYCTAYLYSCRINVPCARTITEAYGYQVLVSNIGVSSQLKLKAST